MELSVHTGGQGRGDVSTRAAEASSGPHRARGLAEPSAGLALPSQHSRLGREAARERMWWPGLARH